MFLEFQVDWIKIVDFLLVAMFKACLLFLSIFYEWLYFRIVQCVSYCRKKMRDYVKGGGALWRAGGSLHLRQYQRQATPVTPRCVRALA